MPNDDIAWLQNDGKVVSCTEKIKVMQQNMLEFKQIAQDLLEDGVLMEIQEDQIKNNLKHVIEKLNNPYKK